MRITNSLHTVDAWDYKMINIVMIFEWGLFEE